MTKLIKKQTWNIKYVDGVQYAADRTCVERLGIQKLKRLFYLSILCILFLRTVY